MCLSPLARRTARYPPYLSTKRYNIRLARPLQIALPNVVCSSLSAEPQSAEYRRHRASAR